MLTLPNLITLAAFACALAAILLVFADLLLLSFLVILIGFVADLFDGYAARRLSQTSHFGAVLDAHVDVFLYLLYPVVFFAIGLGMQELSAALVYSLFCMAGVFRLARTVATGFGDDFRYTGLPVVFSLLLVATAYLLHVTAAPLLTETTLVLLLLISGAMVARFPFPKPKRLWWVLVIVGILFGGTLVLLGHAM